MIDLIHSDEQRNLIYKQLKNHLSEEAMALSLMYSIDEFDAEAEFTLSQMAREFIWKLQITPEPLVTVACSDGFVKVHVSWPRPVMQ